MEQKGSNSELLMLLGKAHSAMDAGDYSQALQLFEQGLELKPGLLDLRFGKALALKNLGQVQDARGLLESIVQEAPSHSGAAQILSQLGSIASAATPPAPQSTSDVAPDPAIDSLCVQFLSTYTNNLDYFRSRRTRAFNLHLFEQLMRGLGILNFENEVVSGEKWFLEFVLSHFSEATIFDVGASHGAYSSLIKKISPTARVFAFEPSPTAFEYLKQNAQTHGFIATNAGCSNTAGKMDLYDYDTADGSAHASVYKDVIEVNHRGKSQAISVAMTTVDGFAAEHSLSKVNLLKVDTEGHELPVLQGAERLIRSGAVEVIHIEFNEMNVYSRTFFKDFCDFLPDFEFFRMLPDGLLHLGAYRPLTYELFAFQNIAAIRRDSTLLSQIPRA